MKNKLLKFLCVSFHNVYSYNCSKKINSLHNTLYTYWLSNNISKIGISSRIGIGCDLKGGQHIEIGEHTIISNHCIINCWDRHKYEKYTPSIKIGSNCHIGEYSHITSINSIIIGNNVRTGRRILITDNSHGQITKEDLTIAPALRKLHTKGPVIIDDNVWIGDKVTITADVHIGKGAVIAANAVVTRDVPPLTVVGGVPAKIIKQF